MARKHTQLRSRRAIAWKRVPLNDVRVRSLRPGSTHSARPASSDTSDSDILCYRIGDRKSAFTVPQLVLSTVVQQGHPTP